MMRRVFQCFQGVPPKKKVLPLKRSGSPVRLPYPKRQRTTIEGDYRKKQPIVSGYLYLLKEREFRKTHESIYKIGRTVHWRNRFTAYPKDSLVIAFHYMDDILNVEGELIDSFDTQFLQRKDIGREYYEGERRCMMKAFFDFIIPRALTSSYPQENFPLLSDANLLKHKRE